MHSGPGRTLAKEVASAGVPVSRKLSSTSCELDLEDVGILISVPACSTVLVIAIEAECREDQACL